MIATQDSNAPAENLATPESFNAIGDTVARSAALFTEAGKVLTHARCVNCHPAGDRPRQGDVRGCINHRSPVEMTALACRPCAVRFVIRRRISNPVACLENQVWHLAPIEMGWEGKTLGEICAQIKDPARNGGRSLDEIVHHIGTDHLVGWALAPEGGPPAGARHAEAQAGALLDAWVTLARFNCIRFRPCRS